MVPDRTRSTAACGIELFAGSARITVVCREMVVQMMEPWDIGRRPRYDVRSRELDSMLTRAGLDFVWLPPP